MCAKTRLTSPTHQSPPPTINATTTAAGGLAFFAGRGILSEENASVTALKRLGGRLAEKIKTGLKILIPLFPNPTGAHLIKEKWDFPLNSQ